MTRRPTPLPAVLGAYGTPKDRALQSAGLHPTGVVALLTDFGHDDPFVGIMKGVILSRCPWAQVVDLSHGVPPQDVRVGALHLMAAVRYFPRGTLFVAVVDPGVGSKRPVVWARSDHHMFLAPDNGLLSYAARVHPLREVRKVLNRKLFLPEPSRTFHGRDIFAPVAASLAAGTAPDELGPGLRAPKRIPFPSPVRRGRRTRGTVLVVDRFGNALTDIRPEDVRRGARFEVLGSELGPLRRSYSSVPPGRPLAIEGSLGFVELSIREGNFASERGVRVGEAVYAG